METLLNEHQEIDRIIISSIFLEKSNTEIAQTVGYSVSFVKRRIAAIFRQYGVKSKVGLVREILKTNINKHLS